MKRTLTLLLTAALGMASAQSAAATPDARLSTATVTVEMGTYSGPLSSMLAAIAKAAGYEIVFDTNVDSLPGAGATPTAASVPGTVDASGKPVVYSFSQKPFNQVWPLLMDIYGLTYQVTSLGGKDVLRVGNSPIQSVIPLKNASASDAETRVKLFFGTPVYSETQQKDAAGNVTGTSRVVTDVKLDSPTLRIIGDPRTNSLIVRGTNREIADVQRLVSQIDTAAAGPRTVYSVKGSVADVQSVLAQQFPTIQVTPTGKNNQVILAGAPESVSAALALLTQVDQSAPSAVSGPVVIQKIFTLNNARAADVQLLLQGGGLPGQQITTQKTTAVNNATPTQATDVSTTNRQTVATDAQTVAGLDPTLQILADVRTNTLVVRGTQTQIDQVAALIPQLDQRVPLINVQVRIQEISETGSRALGLDWNVGFGNFVTKLVSGNLTGLFDATKSLAGLNIGATLNALETQGLTKRVYDGTVTMQSGQRGGQTGGLTENTTAGAAATLKSGGRIELNLPGSGGSPAVQKQIDYGVTLLFNNPQVAGDGTIALNLDALVNQPNSPISPSANLNFLDFSNREAQTTLNLKSGQTVMLGGLLSTNETTSTRGVPFLSSIPIIGPLFSTTTKTSERSQLLIVLTANVVN